MRERIRLLAAAALASAALALLSPLVAQQTGARPGRLAAAELLPDGAVAYVGLTRLREAVETGFADAMRGTTEEERRRATAAVDSALAEIRAGLAAVGLTPEEIWSRVEGVHVALLEIRPDTPRKASVIAVLETKDDDWLPRVAREQIAIHLPDPPAVHGVKIYELGDPASPLLAAVAQRFLILGNDRRSVEAAAGRSQGVASGGTLAGHPLHRELRADAPPGRYLDAFVDTPAVLAALRPHLDEGQKASLAKLEALLRLKELRPATFRGDLTPGGAVGRLRPGMAAGAPLYDLIRQPPGRSDFGRVLPPDAAAALILRLGEPAKAWKRALDFILEQQAADNPGATPVPADQVETFLSSVLGMTVDELLGALGDDLGLVVRRPARPVRSEAEAQELLALAIEGKDAETLRAAWSRILGGPLGANLAGLERREEKAAGASVVSIGEAGVEGSFAYALADRFLVLGRTAAAVRPSAEAACARGAASGGGPVPATLPEPGSKWALLDTAAVASLAVPRLQDEKARRLLAVLAPHLGRLTLTTREAPEELELEVRSSGLLAWLGASPAGPVLGTALLVEALKPSTSGGTGPVTAGAEPPGRTETPPSTAATTRPPDVPPPSDARPFRMGFTSWPYAATAEAVADTYRLIGGSGDLVVQHIEGVPWMEAQDGAPFPKAFQDGLEQRRRHQPPGCKLLLSLSPLNMGRNGLGGPENAPLPGAFRDRALNDPAVKSAYRDYCRRLVAHFRPDWLLTGIEANEVLTNAPASWPAYLELSREVRASLRREFPDLPVAESVTLHKLADMKNPGLWAYRARIREFVADQDFLAVSFYPMFLGMHGREAFDGALASLRELSDRPVALVECGHPAEPVEAKAFGFAFPSTPGEQDAFVGALLGRAQADRWLLVALWAVRDFDALWETFPAEAKDLGRLWRDTGLYDGQGVGRPALGTWKGALARPFRR